MRGGMQYDSIKGQGHDSQALQSWKSGHFQQVLLQWQESATRLMAVFF